MRRILPRFDSRTVRTAAFLIVIFCLAWVIYGDVFFNAFNLRNILRQSTMIGLISMGMCLVIVGGGIDLSVGTMCALLSVTAAYLSRYGVAPAVAGTLALGLLLGCLNGILTAKLRIVPFIATLATMMTFRGLTYIVTNVQSVPVPRSEKTFIALGRGFWLGLPVPVWIVLVVAILLHHFSFHTRTGREIFAAGDNEDAAKMLGANVAKARIVTYALTGLLTALAGVILAARLGAGQPLGAEGWEMNAIAAVLIGGTLLSGGQGSIIGTCMGVVILGLFGNMINLHGEINAFWQRIVTGVLLLGAVFMQWDPRRGKGN